MYAMCLYQVIGLGLVFKPGSSLTSLVIVSVIDVIFTLTRKDFIVLFIVTGIVALVAAITCCTRCASRALWE